MTRTIAQGSIALLALALIPILATATHAGEFTSQGSFGANFFNSSPPCPVKKFPTFESLVPVPGIIDPFEQDLIPMFCDIQVDKEGKGVKNAKGKYETELIIRDNDTGFTESFPIQSGGFRTNRDGRANFDFELPTEIFADGFESGDVSAWSYTRTDFTNKKSANAAQVACQSSASGSN